MKNVMVDLETMGNGSNAAIVSIGAVVFEPKTGQLEDEFLANIDLESSVNAGGVMDASTVIWWMKQSEDARKNLGDGLKIDTALFEFSEWMKAANASFVWGNGAPFDNVILGNAYDRLKIVRPWSHWNDRCYRTLKNLMPDVKLERVGTHHNALDDAKSQALHAIKLLNIIA